MVHMESTVLDTVLILWDMVMAILATLLLDMAMDMVLAMVPMDLESVMLMLSQKLMPMLSMDHMESTVLDIILILWDMVMAILATAMDMVWAMAVMGMESVMLRLSQRLMPMLSMDHMESTVLDTALILWDMVMAILAMAMDMVLAMAVMGMESAMLNQSLMLSMEPMVGMAMDLETVHTPWDMVMDLAMVMDMEIMVDRSETTNQERHYNDLFPPSTHYGPNIYLG